MARWLAISNRTNWEVTRKKNIWGVSQRSKNVIGRAKPGDTVLIYVSQRAMSRRLIDEHESDPFSYQQKEGDTLLPSAVTRAFEVVLSSAV